MWQQPDGSLHMLWHNRGAGYHGFAAASGAQWAVSPSGAHAFTLSVPLAGGGTIDLSRRERPELRFDNATGVPIALYTAMQRNDTTCGSLVQPIAA